MTKRFKALTVTMMMLGAMLLGGCESADNEKKNSSGDTTEQTTDREAAIEKAEDATTATETDSKDELITISYYAQLAPSFGRQTGWGAKVLKDALGINFNYVQEPKDAELIGWGLAGHYENWLKGDSSVGDLELYGISEGEIKDKYKNISTYMMLETSKLSKSPSNKICAIATNDYKAFSISKNVRNPEMILEVIDYMCSPEFAIIRNCGPKGDLWDVSKDGWYYLIDNGFDMVDAKLSDGSNIKDGFIQDNMGVWNPECEIPGAEHHQIFDCCTWPVLKDKSKEASYDNLIFNDENNMQDQKTFILDEQYIIEDLELPFEEMILDISDEAVMQQIESSIIEISARLGDSAEGYYVSQYLMMADDLNSAPNRERYECSLFVLDKDKKPVGRLIVNKKQEAVNVYPDYYLNPMIEIDTLKNNPDTEYLPFKYGVIRYMSSENTMDKDFETVGIQIQGDYYSKYNEKNISISYNKLTADETLVWVEIKD